MAYGCLDSEALGSVLNRKITAKKSLDIVESGLGAVSPCWIKEDGGFSMQCCQAILCASSALSGCDLPRAVGNAAMHRRPSGCVRRHERDLVVYISAVGSIVFFCKSRLGLTDRPFRFGAEALPKR